MRFCLICSVAITSKFSIGTGVVKIWNLVKALWEC